MNTVLDFIRSAAPWIAAGLLLAILAVRGITRKKKGKSQTGDYSLEGMSPGMCFGMLIGTAVGDNIGIGVSLGMIFGLAVGLCIQKKPEGSDK